MGAGQRSCGPPLCATTLCHCTGPLWLLVLLRISCPCKLQDFIRKYSEASHMYELVSMNTQHSGNGTAAQCRPRLSHQQVCTDQLSKAEVLTRNSVVFRTLLWCPMTFAAPLPVSVAQRQAYGGAVALQLRQVLHWPECCTGPNMQDCAVPLDMHALCKCLRAVLGPCLCMV
jgi:hypothetical protein